MAICRYLILQALSNFLKLINNYKNFEKIFF